MKSTIAFTIAFTVLCGCTTSQVPPTSIVENPYGTFEPSTGKFEVWSPPVSPKVVQIQFQVVEISSSDMPFIADTNSLSVASIAGLIEQDKAAITHTLAITTQVGQPATIKGVLEYIYPTEFSTTGIDDGNVVGESIGDDAEVTVGSVITPRDFTTREVGTILEVQPEMSPTGDILISLSPEVVYEPEVWSMETFSNSRGDNQAERMQPIFKTLKLQTGITLKDRERIVLAVCPKAGNKDVTTAVIIGANILN